MKKKSKTPPSVTSSKSVSGSKSASSPMNLDLLEQLVKLMSANDLNTVDLRDGDQRVVLRRGPRYVASTTPTVQAASIPPAPVTSTPALPSVPGGSDTGSKSDDESGLIAIKSPMVGTFYAKPNPDAKNFVNVGSVVNEDTDVCIIEAMKVFNNIKAECRGTIVKILAEDGKPVEFGQVLFLVKPA